MNVQLQKLNSQPQDDPLIGNERDSDQSMSISQLMEQCQDSETHQKFSSQTSSHVNNLRQFIKTFIIQVKLKARRISIQALKARRTNNSEKFSKQNVEKAVEVFEKTSNNIIEAFAFVAFNEDYLKFETEDSLKQKLNNLKKQVQRSFHETIKMSSKSSNLSQSQGKFGSNAGKGPKGKNCKTAPESTVVLEKWLSQHFYFPYPTQTQRQNLARQSGIGLAQVNNWFINKREKIIRKYLRKEACLQERNEQNYSENNQSESSHS